MPNWCENIIHIYGPNDSLKEVIEAVKSEHSAFDFNKIIPMPEIYRNTASGSREFAIEGSDTPVRLTSWYEKGRECRPFTDAEREELSGYGFLNWYDWACANWGTKWNACHVDEPDHDVRGETLRFQFDTAWCPPAPVIAQLRNRFPDLEIVASCRDEDEEEYEDY